MNTSSPWFERLLLWLLLSLIPSVAVWQGIRETCHKQNQERTLMVRKLLLSEIKDFQREVKPHLFFDEVVNPIWNDPPPPLTGTNTRTNTEPGIPISRREAPDAQLLAELRQRLESSSGSPLAFLILAGQGGQPVYSYLNPAVPWSDNLPAFTAELHEVVQRFYGVFAVLYPHRDAEPIGLDLGQRSQRLFGIDGHLPSIAEETKPFTSRFGGFSKWYWGHRRGPPIPGSSKHYPALSQWIYGFRTEDINPHAMLAHAVQKSRPEIRRELAWVAPRDAPIFENNASATIYTELVLPSGFQEALTREAPEKRREGLHPALRVRLPAHELQPWLQKLAIPLVGFLVLFNTFTFGIAARAGSIGKTGSADRVRTSLLKGFGMALAPLLLALFVLVLGWVTARREALPLLLRFRLELMLDRFDWRIWQHWQQGNRALRAFESDCIRLLEKPPAETRRGLEEFINHGIGGFAFLLLPDGREFTAHVADNFVNKDVVPLFKGYIDDVLREVQAESGGTTGPGRKDLDLSKTIAEQYFDSRALERLMADEALLQRAPFGSMQQWFFCHFLRQGLQRTFKGALIVGGRFGFLEHMLRRALRQPGIGKREAPGFSADFHLYKYSEPYIRDVFSFICLTGLWPDKTVFLQARPQAERCLRDLVPEVLESVNGGSYQLSLFKPLRSDYYIGLARGRLAGEGSRHLGLILLAGCVLLLLLGGILRLTAGSFSGPIHVFLLATRRAAEGDFSWRLQIPTADEFGEMGSVFNGMAEKLIQRERMSRFVSDDVLQTIAGGREKRLRGEGEKRNATVLFSDIRGFTTLSETHPPEEIVAMLNTYFTAMETCIKRHQGTIVSFIGDAILAHFSDPSANPEPPPASGPAQSAATDLPHPPAPRSSALRAAAAAWEMRQALERFNAERTRTQKFPIQTGVGLATGEVGSGIIGSETGRLCHILLGETVERANELEAASKKARWTGIMVDADTRRQIEGEYLSGTLPEPVGQCEAFEIRQSKTSFTTEKSS
jgi:class 3 adenylate cyclase